MTPPDYVCDILNRLQGVSAAGDGKWVARCPAHTDTHPSLSIRLHEQGRIDLKCFVGCEWENILTALSLPKSAIYPPKQEGGGRVSSRKSRATLQHSAQQSPSPSQKKGEAAQNDEESAATVPATPVQHPASESTSEEGCTLEAYAEAKGLPLEFLRSLGLRTISIMSHPAVRIPYLSPETTELAVRFRLALTGNLKFKWKTGAKPALYGLDRIEAAKEAGYVVLVEGESDCHTLWYHKIPALGMPGAATWKEGWAAFLDDIPEVYVLIEPDAGGKAVQKWLSKSPLRTKAFLLKLGEEKDPSSLFLSGPEEFLTRFEAFRQEAPRWTDIEKAAQEVVSSEAWELCCGLACSPNILPLFAEDIAANGVAGESSILKTLYLVVTSRLLDRPVSVLVKGTSSSGKSYTTERTLNYFPASAFYALSAMGDKTLAYSEEPLKHRMLVIYEAAGMQGETATYLLRSLLSEGRIRYETTEKTKDGLRARLMEREGPTGLIVTTTAISIHPENETRMLTLTTTDTEDQTKNILLAQARRFNGSLPPAYDLSQWVALQEWLEGAERRVVVPYAETLAGLMSGKAIRLRRDITTLFTLVSAHALLHQAGREKDSEGRILANLTDYCVVRELIGGAVAEGVAATVPATVRATVDVVKTLVGQETEKTVSVTQIAQSLKMDKSAVSRRVKRAEASGYLINREEGKGKPARIALGEALPEEETILPEIGRLEAAMRGCCSVASESGGYTPSPPLPSTDTCDQVEVPENAAEDDSGWTDAE